MDTKTMWENYHTPGVGPGSDENLITMIQELVNTIKAVERIYGNVRSQLLVRSMLQDYHVLNNMAWHRGLHDIPTLT